MVHSSLINQTKCNNIKFRKLYHTAVSFFRPPLCVTATTKAFVCLDPFHWRECNAAGLKISLRVGDAATIKPHRRRKPCLHFSVTANNCCINLPKNELLLQHAAVEDEVRIWDRLAKVLQSVTTLGIRNRFVGRVFVAACFYQSGVSVKGAFIKLCYEMRLK